MSSRFLHRSRIALVMDWPDVAAGQMWLQARYGRRHGNTRAMAMCRVAHAKGTLSVRVGEFPMTVSYEQKNIVVGCQFGNVLKSVCDGGILQKIAKIFC